MIQFSRYTPSRFFRSLVCGCRVGLALVPSRNFPNIIKNNLGLDLGGKQKDLQFCPFEARTKVKWPWTLLLTPRLRRRRRHQTEKIQNKINLIAVLVIVTFQHVELCYTIFFSYVTFQTEGFDWWNELVTQLTISTLPIYSGYKTFIYICDRKVPFSGLDSLVNEQGFAGNSWLHRLLYRRQQPFSHDRQIPMPDVGHKRELREWRRRRVFVIGISVSRRSEINSSSVKSVSSYFLCVIWLANADN